MTYLFRNIKEVTMASRDATENDDTTTNVTVNMDKKGQSSSHKRKQIKKAFLYPAEGILPPCKVCGDKASGIHFGTISCEACKVMYIFLTVSSLYIVII